MNRRTPMRKPVPTMDTIVPMANKTVNREMSMEEHSVARGCASPANMPSCPKNSTIAPNKLSRKPTTRLNRNEVWDSSA